MEVKPLGALAAYLAMAPVLWYFVLKTPTANVYLNAMFLAFGIFGTYNATTYAILKKYRASLGVLDTLWGMLMFASVSFLFLKFKQL